MSQPRPPWTEEQVENAIGAVLRAGVILAAGVGILGGLLLLGAHGHETVALDSFRRESAQYRSMGGILRGLAGGDSRALIQVAVVLLVATPIARVALALVAFLRQRDRVFTAITALVLALLLFSLLHGAT